MLRYHLHCGETFLLFDFANDFKELDILLESNRLSHRILSKHLHLDAFDDLLAECNEDGSVTSFSGRIISHTAQEFLSDFASNFAFNAATER